MPKVEGLTLSLPQALESGVPYSASNQHAVSPNGVDPQPYVANPGYLTPPDASVTQYFFTDRGGALGEGPAFGTALNRFAYTTPRTFRMNFGVRF